MATMSLFRSIQISVFSRPAQTLTPHFSTSTSCSTSSVRNSRSTPPPLASLPKKKMLVGLGTEEMEAVILVEGLRRSGEDVLMASFEIEGSSGTKLVADAFVTSCTNEIFDLVAFPIADKADTIIDGKLVTRGLISVIDFSLAIVNKLFGHARARSVAEGLVYEYPRS